MKATIELKSETIAIPELLDPLLDDVGMQNREATRAYLLDLITKYPADYTIADLNTLGVAFDEGYSAGLRAH